MKAGSAVRDVDHLLGCVTTNLVTLSRLHALRLLASASSQAKLAAAERVARYADLAVAVDQFAIRHYHRKPQPVVWPAAVRPDVTGVLAAGRIDAQALRVSIRSMVGGLAGVLNDLESQVRRTLLAAPVRPLLALVRSGAPCRIGAHRRRNQTHVEPVPVLRPRQVLVGPTHVHHDPILKPSYSLLEQREPQFGQSLAQVVPYLWTVSIRETLAAELCALSSIEYDGLPLAFHADMSKQAWDEMRHAVYYLDVALGLIPALIAKLGRKDPLRAILLSFRRGQGLPIPLEGNLYEAMLNASLAERLILFQVQTEAPSAARKKRQMESALCHAYPELRVALEYDLRDEIAHARIGQTWLRYLLPSRADRWRAVEMTDRLRSVLILTSFAHHHEVPLPHLIDQCLSGALQPP